MLSPVSSHEVNKFRQRETLAQAAQRRLAYASREASREEPVASGYTRGQRLGAWLRSILRSVAGRQQATS